MLKNCLDKKYIIKINAILHIIINNIAEFMGPNRPPKSLIITPKMKTNGYPRNG
jgi:hypothetical protein